MIDVQTSRKKPRLYMNQEYDPCEQIIPLSFSFLSLLKQNK